MRLSLADADATIALGAALAASRPPGGALLELEGDLGAGKSTLARALLRALGVTGAIRSPTYTLVERYPLADGGEAAHLDLYRVADPDELDYFGLDGLLAAPTLWLVEWPDRGAGRLPPRDLRITLAHAGEGREALFEAHSPRGRTWLEALAAPAPAEGG